MPAALELPGSVLNVVGQWRDVLTDKQVQRLVDDHGAEMARFGYLPA